MPADEPHSKRQKGNHDNGNAHIGAHMNIVIRKDKQHKRRQPRQNIGNARNECALHTRSSRDLLPTATQEGAPKFRNKGVRSSARRF